LLFLLGLFFLEGPVAQAQGIVLKNVVLDSTSHLLSISISLEFVRPNALEMLLKKTGYPVVMEGDIEIKRVRPLLWDRTIVKRYVRYSLVHNPLTDRFVLTDLSTRHVLVCGSFEDVLEKMRFLRLKVKLWRPVSATRDYVLSIRLVLKRQVPWWMERLLFFRSFNISSPQSYSISFRY